MENQISKLITNESDRRIIFIKEIDLIQDIIKRMASNSFLIKGWTVTLVTATLLIKGDDIHVLLAILPTLVFWLLDSYFLWQERLYRWLYGWVIKNRAISDELIFDLKAESRAKAERRADPKKHKNLKYWKVVFSQTIWPFYGIILVLIGIYFLIINISTCGT
ncbi:MAG: hypothetical protein LCH52_08165 [Bacteroidetes bacterium]|nr:hypothetical protein [Bacteroidota bacterium]